MDRGEWVVSLMCHGLQVAGDAAVSGGVARGSEASGDFLFDLGHADIALGPVIRERHVGVAGKAEHFGFVLDEGFVEVFGVGFGDASTEVDPKICTVF